MISNKLKKQLKETGQFPYGKRDKAYQSIDGNPGIRDMEHRYEVIQFPESFDGETVIDFGCSAGAVCLEAKKRGAKRVVGLDYKEETIVVAKELAKELELDIEFYTFNIDDGLDSLKALISEDKFDHVFALSIWAHCDEYKLADMINFYTDKICWFEGHNASTYGDTKLKMDTELERLLDLPYHEHIGETNDRSIRQNYKISRSNRIDISKKDTYLYYSGEVYNTVTEANYSYSGVDLTKMSKTKLPGGKHLVGKNSYIEGKYNFNGKYSCYIGDSDTEIGTKIYIFDSKVTDLKDKEDYTKKIFEVQKILYEGGFAPEPYEIVTCHDTQTFYYAIQMENIKGKFVQPSEEWIKSLLEFCKKNNLKRKSDWTIQADCVPKNCIEVGGKIYLVDIDYKWTNE